MFGNISSVTAAGIIIASGTLLAGSAQAQNYASTENSSPYSNQRNANLGVTNRNIPGQRVNTGGPYTMPNQLNLNHPATITYTDTYPNYATTLRSGQTMTFWNNSSRPISIGSDTQVRDTDLDVGQIAPGHYRTVVLRQRGTYMYHNLLNQSQVAGRVTVL